MQIPIPHFDLIDGQLLRRAHDQLVSDGARNDKWTDSAPPGKRILVKRRGMYHLVDPETQCATISMGRKEARALLGKLKPERFDKPIHTMLGTLP